MDTEKTDTDAKFQRLGSILAEIYGNELADSHSSRFVELIENLSVIPKAHVPNERDVILVTYADNIFTSGQRPLETLRIFSESHLKGLINSIHLLPHYPSTCDRGFGVSDYLAVDLNNGTWQDVQEIGREFHLMLDGVFNHSSSSHEWFKRFLAGDPKYAEYYVAFDTSVDASLVTRPRAHPLLTPFETPTGTKYVWSTFSADQVDLNYHNPNVLYDIIATLLEYVKYGADLIRFDAVGFIWKELGTSSLHLPQAHAIVRFMREVLELAAPWVWLVTETNVPHEENIAYFGNGHNEAKMVYNFTLPTILVHTLQTGDATSLTGWAKTLEVPSSETHFFNFTASHDGIGLRGVTGILSETEITNMCDRAEERGGYLSMKSNTDGSESVYEMNISYFNAVADPSLDRLLQVGQFLSTQAVALSLKGVPGIYVHSLLGSENWKESLEETGIKRAINRERLRAEVVERELQDQASLRKQIFDRYSHLLAIRTKESAFSPLASQTVRDYGPAVFGVERVSSDGQQTILALHNITNNSVTLTLEKDLYDLIEERNYQRAITLKPYQTVWLKG